MKPENYLKNAGMRMEDDYGMIDETELLSRTDFKLNKLSAMTDEDYEKLELYPDIDE